MAVKKDIALIFAKNALIDILFSFCVKNLKCHYRIYCGTAASKSNDVL
jgi:hypothetical protein